MRGDANVRLLITGPLGHIGSRLIHSLRPGDCAEVRLLDNFATSRYCSLFNLPEGVPFRFTEGDIRTVDLGRLLDGIDRVIHLAAITNAAESFDQQEQVDAVNLGGTARLAQACADRGIPLIFVSTTSVYGTQADTIDEACDSDELRPQSPYATSKLKAERVLHELGATRGLRYFVGRLGTICGTSPGMRFHTAINKFCWQACTGQPLTVYRTALDQLRPYLDLADAIRAFRFVLRSELFDNRVYNVLTANWTVRQIVDLIRAEMPGATVQLVDTRVMNQLSCRVSAERFERAGFRFEGSLDEGILQTLDLLRGVARGSTTIRAASRSSDRSRP